jgi:O-antigen/teichoic acid export membrane protein
VRANFMAHRRHRICGEPTRCRCCEERRVMRRLAAHVANYSVGGALVTLAALVSFPILTRVLSVDEYGVMNLIATALALLVGLAKMGLQHSAVRFYSEVKAGKHGVGTDGYASTVLFGMAALGLLATILWAAGSQILPQSWWNDERVAPLMLFTSVLIVVRVVDSAFINQLRAQEESAAITIYSVLRRYAILGAVLGVLFFVSKSIWGFFAATVIAEAIATLAFAVWMLHRLKLRLAAFSVPLFQAMLIFGMPMIGYELSSVLLAMGDRYVIQTVIGAQPLGTYSAAYNLCDYVRALFLASFAAAVLPMYPRIWEEQGPDATVSFLTRFLRMYVMVAMLVVAGLSAISGEVLAFLASEKYRSGGDVVPLVMGGMAMEGLVMVVGAGLYIEKRSKTIMLLLAAAAALNLLLNVAWVPTWGISGAALATLVSYAVLLCLSIAMGRKRLAITVPWACVIKFGLIGLLTYVVAGAIQLEGDLATIIARAAIGVPLYAAISVLFDREARGLGRELLARAGWAA